MPYVVLWDPMYVFNGVSDTRVISEPCAMCVLSDLNNANIIKRLQVPHTELVHVQCVVNLKVYIKLCQINVIFKLKS